jgi:ketosteroid isomerase-like protein
MRKINLATLAIILAVAGQSYAKADKDNNNNDGKTQQTLIKIEHEWVDALAKKDADKLDHILASDWSMVTPTGKIVSKSEALNDLKSGTEHYDSVTMGDMNVRIYGNTAVVRGSSEEKSQYNGQDTSGHYVFNDVFVKRDGNWKAVSTQLTRVTGD